MQFAPGALLNGVTSMLLVALLVILSACVQAAPSYYPLGENPVMRQYKLFSLMGAPYANAGGEPMAAQPTPSRKMARAASAFKSRNCFFSPVQCHLSKSSLENPSNLRRRRRLLGGSAAVSNNNFEDYPVAAEPSTFRKREWSEQWPLVEEYAA